MAALTGPRNTKERGQYYRSEEQFAKTNVVFYQGQMVAVDATGYIAPAVTSTALKRVCRVNLTGIGLLRSLDMTGLASGSKKVKIEFGEFLWNNSASADQITQADVGNQCYVVDDNTVAKTSGSSTRSVAGTIMEVDTSGQVWVLHEPA